MNFFYYDIAFLVIFILITSIFLYRKRKHVSLDSKILLLYRTKFGIRLINKINKKYSRLLKFIAPISISIAYLLMAGVIYLLIQSIVIMYKAPITLKVPPLMPLIPYMPKIFKITFLPPFYFTYWIIILIITASIHEFSHGIFAKNAGVKVKSTGFGFLGPFILAFVEPNEKQMAKKRKKDQLAILSAGSFSNLILFILFVILLQFFVSAYYPIGVNSYIYAMHRVPLNMTSYVDYNSTKYQPNLFMKNAFNITRMTNTTNINITDTSKENAANATSKSTSKPIIIKIVDNEKRTCYITNDLMQQFDYNLTYFVCYDDAPAFRSNLTGSIKSMDGVPIYRIQDILKTIHSHKPNETMSIETTTGNYTIKLKDLHGKAYLGIAFPKVGRIASIWVCFTSPHLNPFLDVRPRFNEDITNFIKYFLFWAILINISVALFNMMPFGIFDGGRMAFIGLLGLTRKKRRALLFYKILSLLMVAILFALMIVWMIKL